MEIRTLLRAGFGASLVLSAFSANAHVKIISHPMRNSIANIKEGTCGKSPDARSTNINTFLSGSTITLQWDEFVPHPGSFRIAFDDDGDDFPEPSSYEDLAPTPEPGTTLIATGLFQHTSAQSQGIYSFDVTLPDIECDNCTLQLTQLMTDKPPYTVGGNDIYYNCLDVTLTKDDTKVPPPPPPLDFAGGSCAVQTPNIDAPEEAPFFLLGFAGLAAGVYLVSRKKK
jgi:hypothetical protein